MTVSPGGPPRGVPTLWRALVACYGVVFVVLAITGTTLVFVYRPLPEGAMTPDRYLRLAHAAVADLATAGALPTLLIGAILTLSTRRPRRWGILALAATACALALLGTFTGSLLPWDQVGGVEAAADTLRAWLIAHVVVGALAAVVATTASWRRRRDRTLPTDP